MHAPEGWDPSLQVRPIDADDAEGLSSLFARCADYFELVQGAPAGDEEVDDFLTDCPEDRTEDDLYCFGVFAGDELVAAASNFKDFPDPDTWWIGMFLVEPDRRGTGLGRAFFEALYDWFLDQRALEIQLGVLEPNEGGREFWVAMGFEHLRPGRPVVEGVPRPVPTEVLSLRL